MADELSGIAKTTRRDLLLTTAGLTLMSNAVAQGGEGKARVHKGRIKQSMVQWCYAEAWPDISKMIDVAKSLNIGSIELSDAKLYGTIKKAGLEIAIGSIDMSPNMPFDQGFNNPKYHDKVIKATKLGIDQCAEHGIKSLIAFTGMAEGLSYEAGAENCVMGFKQVVEHAEKKGVTICLEMLNTRASDHPMKGHPGYQGDHTDYCIDIIKRVGSPYLKILFDIYHVQIMDGDVIRRIHQHKDYIGHVHTAGNPGRAELDDTQEINYPPILRALLEIGYKGWVGQEFIPTRDALVGLREAVELCDV
jgi:hydroxypyruvate isomerase